MSKTCGKALFGPGPNDVKRCGKVARFRFNGSYYCAFHANPNNPDALADRNGKQYTGSLEGLKRL